MAGEQLVATEMVLMAQAIDDLAVSDPERVICKVPTGPNVRNGFYELTVRDIACAVDHMAWWIDKSLGCSSAPETLAYIGMNDIRYLVVILACNKTGYQALLSSTRNTKEAHVHLLHETHTSKLAYSADREEKAMAIKKAYDTEKQGKTTAIEESRPALKLLKIPPLADLLLSRGEYPIRKRFESVEDETAFIIHSSGTTGMPKPIFLTHGFLGALINAISLPLPKGRSTVMPQRIHSDDLLLVTTPFYHIMGFISFILSVFYGLPFLIPPDKPVSPELATDMLLTTKPTAAVFAPYILEQMSLLSSSMDALSTLRFIYFGGAPLSRAAGEKISGRSNLVNFLGSSETGFIPSMIPEERQNWEYFEWNPNYGLRMEPIGRNLFELIIPRPKRRDFHAIFHTYPKSREYHTNDLFTPHPTQPDLWKYQGRLDDTIVLTNGEKVNPILMEKTIEDHPLVSRAVIVGQNRFQTALLIEPNWEKWNEKAGHLVDQIWPTVQQANRLYPGHAHIMRNKICLASRNKPFETTPKGSTQRRRVLLDYMQEIDAVYADAGDSTIVDALPWDSSLSDVTRFVQRTVSELLPQKVSEQDDLFAAGLDSGQALYLSEILRGAASFPVDAKRAIMLQTVYANPTVQQLSSTIHSVLHGNEEKQPYRELKIRTILQKYASDIPERIPGSAPFDNVHTVILTGSTGSLGSYILSKLIKDPQVAKVYCLNRSVAREKQIASFREKGLSFDCYELAKMEFLQVDLSQKMFGLRSDIYDELLRSVDTIIHNAWMVDFNHPVDSFEPHISGLRRFVDFSVQSAHNAHILFASSIATVGAWKTTLGPVVPEVPLEDCDVVVRQGYGESKHIGERICLEASRRAGVPTTIIRFGQIAGPTTEMGIWNRHEWLPAMITSSKAMGKIPKALGSMRVDWIPVDTVATIILEVINTRRGTQTDQRCAAFHVVNPCVASWQSFLPLIERVYHVTPVELAEWVEELKQVEVHSDAISALKLLNFYSELAAGDTFSVPIGLSQIRKASATFSSLNPISENLMKNWLQQWSV